MCFIFANPGSDVIHVPAGSAHVDRLSDAGRLKADQSPGPVIQPFPDSFFLPANVKAVGGLVEYGQGDPVVGAHHCKPIGNKLLTGTEPAGPVSAVAETFIVP